MSLVFFFFFGGGVALFYYVFYGLFFQEYEMSNFDYHILYIKLGVKIA